MTYRVLARAYRSRTFDEVVGQEAIATTLKNAIRAGRVHHAYLFTGTRGVGKTSMARILAKALNCLEFEAATVEPCLHCDSCRLIAEGEDVDVIEIDGASNRGIDDIRALRNNATLRPSRSRFKVYIIDEVHALTKDAFNALLKTLEEPPPHVKFIFATTEPEKVLETIKSRCQRFDFRAINTEAIASHLAHVLEGEKIKADEDAVRRIARLANGSMRDGLSLMDKVLSYENEHVTVAILDEIIPPPHDELAAAVLDAVAGQDAAAALDALDKALQSGRTVDRFCDQLIDHVRTLMVLEVCGAESELVDVASSMRPAMAAQAEKFDGPSYVYMINLLEGLRRAVRTGGAGRALADAALIRLALTQQFTRLDDLIGALERGDTAASREKKKLTEPPAAVAITREKRSLPATKRAPRAATPPRSAPRSAPPLMSPPLSAPAGPEIPLSSQERDRVAADPLVQRVRDAVDGTLIDIRQVAGPKPDDTRVSPDGQDADEGLLDGLESPKHG